MMNFKLHTSQQLGGAKIINYNIYCGNKPVVPKGKVRGRPNQCYKLGLRSGFYAGITKGKKVKPVPVEQINPIDDAVLNFDNNNVKENIRRSIKELYKGVKKTTRLRDFMAVLPIQNPEYNYGGSKYKSVKQKKLLGTEGLRQWLINEIKEYKE